MRPHEFALDAMWRPLLADLGVRPADVLRRAELPLDLFSKTNAKLPTADYYRLLHAIDEELSDPLLPLTLAKALRPESFSPPFFAAMCSPNLLVALKRIQHYKPLVGPLRLTIDEEDSAVVLGIDFLDKTLKPPQHFLTTELLFFVGIARNGTREMIRPLALTSPRPPEPAGVYEEFLGRRIVQGERLTVTFSRADALRRFLTANDGMWSMFEPELRRRLDELDAAATVAERVRAVLLEGLPSGQVTMDSVARKLALSKRTLQRRLSKESTSYQQVLQGTRLSLARHYLQRTALPAAEISFLLGFEEPNSFYRAFNDWTGQTPETLRRAGMH